jgi:hypothetical protein
MEAYTMIVLFEWMITVSSFVFISNESSPAPNKVSVYP